ncbi:MAG TPA: DUF2971 domain-containing protein [Steroidobacteraceae bacterium]|nr:DUF2971 domain-containing protein [Steroidobacteraceae bacterium]
MLAHYTSIDALEGIVRSNELWFSHPLAMNDSEELRFGMQLGASVFRGSQALAVVCKTPQRHGLLLSAFENAFNHFWNAHAFDTYVFCTSEHEKNDNNGRLSMWRGYGGNGTGSAIVLDTAKLNVYDESPLILDRVTYATRDERTAWVQSRTALLAETLQKLQPPDEQLHIPAIAFLERLKRFSLFTKDRGFHEENEWRALYVRERDTQKQLDGMFGYATGRNGMLPRLKLKIEPLEGSFAKTFSLSELVYRIILGPSQSGPLALMTVRRMLGQLGKAGLAEQVVASTIPYTTARFRPEAVQRGFRIVAGRDPRSGHTKDCFQGDSPSPRDPPCPFSGRPKAYASMQSSETSDTV